LRATDFAGSPEPFGQDTDVLQLAPATSRDYAELRRKVENANLYAKQPMFYLFAGTVALGTYAGSLALVFLADSLWLSALAGLIQAFASVHLGFLTHDAGHRQVFRRSLHNDILGTFTGFLLGIGLHWWIDKHNRHHALPNVLGEDPDINLGILAFSNQQAKAYRGLFRFLTRFQVYTFLPLLALEGLGMKAASLQWLVMQRKRGRWLELSLVLVHHVLLIGFLGYFSGWPSTVVFLVFQHLGAGLYFSAVFAPNHKGQPVFDEEPDLDFITLQLATARNIRNSHHLDFLYGGQNFQIEHHLFPSMPRCNLPRASRLVRPFCESRQLRYHETGLLGSMAEILRHLNQVSGSMTQNSSQVPN
jgi:fatty acid desaturase